MSKELVKPVRMILTEAELTGHISYIERNKSTLQQEIVKSLLNNIGYSHQALFSANAELSFKNMKLKEALTDIDEIDTSNWHDDARYMKSIATKALEELK